MFPALVTSSSQVAEPGHGIAISYWDMVISF
jgi:hypothetical protein